MTAMASEGQNRDLDLTPICPEGRCRSTLPAQPHRLEASCSHRLGRGAMRRGFRGEDGERGLSRMSAAPKVQATGTIRDAGNRKAGGGSTPARLKRQDKPSSPLTSHGLSVGVRGACLADTPAELRDRDLEAEREERLSYLLR